MTRCVGLSLAITLAACATRTETEVLVVVVPTGFATATDASSVRDAGLASLGSVVVEARAVDSSPVCDSRSTAPTTAAIAVDALHGVHGSVYTLGVVPEGGTATRITVWGKVGGLDRARRSFVVRPSTSTQRVLCVALAPDTFDCQCADLTRAIEISGGQSGVAAAVDACVAAIGAASIPGLGASMACAAFDPATCAGTIGAVRDRACDPSDASTRDAGPTDARAASDGSETPDAGASDGAGPG